MTTKFTLKALTAAVTLALSGGAVAVDLDANPVVPVAFAQERVANATTPLTASALDVQHTLGFGVSQSQTRYIRYDLGNATIFGTLTAGALSIAANSSAPSVEVAQGGGPNSTFVIFQITANEATPASAGVDFCLASCGSGGIKVVNKASPATISYSLYETAAAAVSGGEAGRLASKTGSIATFPTGLVFSTTRNQTIVDVSATPIYTKFTGGGVPDGFKTTLLAAIGKVTVLPAMGVVQPTGSQVQLSNLLAAGTKLVVSGNMDSALTTPNKVFIGSSDCSGVSNANSGITALSAQITTNALELADQNVCFQTNGTTTIAEGSYTIALDVVAAPSSNTQDPASTGLGSFKRNGTTLRVPFMNSFKGQLPFVQVQNTSNGNAPFTVTCYGTAATVPGKTGLAVPALRTRAFGVVGGLGCPSTTTAVDLVFSVVPGSVNGMAVLQNQTSGDAGMTNTIGNTIGNE